LAHALAEPAQRNRKWADLRLRVLSAAVLAPLALLCIWIGGWLWVALVALGAVGLAREWLTLCRGRGPVWKLAGIVYVLPACAALLWLRGDPARGRADVFFLLLVVWATDIGAYVVGRLVGGPKLAPSISPGKTRAGALGGMLWAAGVGIGAALLSGSPMLAAIVVALVLSVVAQAGDLLESAMKRIFGVKDSGNTIPGHGGLFDRLDGVLTAAPVAAAFVLARGGAIWH
jgi:phosphatidate cytidylyltransferase